MHYFAFPFFFSYSSNLAFVFCMPSFFHCSCLIGFIFQQILPVFSIHIWLIASMAFNSVYKFVFLYFTFRYSTLLITSSCMPLQSVTFRFLLLTFLHITSFTLLVVFLVVFVVSGAWGGIVVKALHY